MSSHEEGSVDSTRSDRSAALGDLPLAGNEPSSIHLHPVQTDRPISEYVRLESLILSTPSADAYRAYDESRKQACSVWVSRPTLSRGSPEILQFLRKLEVLDRIEPPLCELSGYGVDSEGRAFALFPALDGYKVSGGNLEASEVERRFTACLNLVAKLHTAGIALGDLSADSFWMNRNGDIMLVGLLGCVTKDARTSILNCPASSKPFMAPELVDRGVLTPAGDVYSLGMLGYFLFTKKFSDESGAKILEQVQNPPPWADEIISRALLTDPSDRYSDAGAMLQDLSAIRSRVARDDSMPVVRSRSSNPVQVMGESLPGVREEYESSPAVIRKSTVGVPASQAVLLLLIAIVLGVALLFLSSVMTPESRIDNSVRLEERLKPVLDAVKNEPIAKDLEGLSNPNLSFREKQVFIQKLSESDDPFAHDALVKSAQEAPNEEFRAGSERALLDRARRQGLTRTAEQTRMWLRTLRASEYPAAYEPLLQVLDKALPEEVRFASLRRAYSTEPQVALRIATALAFDLDALSGFQPLLSQLIGDSLRLKNAKERAAITLIMSHPELSALFGEDVLQFRQNVPDQDITWLMSRLAVQRDIHVRAIANMALERKLVSPVQSLFLEIIRDRSDLTASLLTAFIRGATASLEKEDIAAFGRWYDIQSEEVLLAALVSLHDEEMAKQAIETLAGKSMSREPAASFVQWVRSTEWERRAKFARLAGMLGNLDRVPVQDIQEELKILDSIAQDSDLLEILLDTDHPVVVQSIVSRYADTLGLGTLLTLLDNGEASVRKQVVRALKRFNDLGALKIIIDHYEREQDPEVKEVYREAFWVIRKREEDAGRAPEEARQDPLADL